MKKTLFFSFLLSVAVFSSCTQEEISLSTEANIEEGFDNLKTLQREVFTDLRVILKSFSPEELQALATSSNPFEMLESDKTGIDVKNLENKLEQFSVNLQLLKDSGVTDAQLQKTLVSNAKEINLTGNDLLNYKANSALGTPCYDTWEITFVSATVAYAACVTFSAGSGLAGCTFAYGTAILFADDQYEKCMQQYNER